MSREIDAPEQGQAVQGDAANPQQCETGREEQERKGAAAQARRAPGTELRPRARPRRTETGDIARS